MVAPTEGQGDTPAIEFAGVTKRFGDLAVVVDLSLAIAEREFVVLLGPSGCGKSTILKMIAGIEDPSEGDIYVGGGLVNYVAPRDRDVAMVFQNYALYPHMSVTRNIGFPLRARFSTRLPWSEVQRRVDDVARLVDLKEHMHKFPGQLSGGQRQRVALARAIIRQPVAFLMDEPLSNLDALLRTEMRQNLLDVHKAVGRATVYVTHDQLEAMTMADRIVVLREGRLQQIGTPQDTFERPANLFVAGFVGSPAMNFLEGSVTGEDTVRLADTEIATGAALGGRVGEPVTVGIRPSDAVLERDAAGANAIAGTVARVEYGGADHFYDIALTGGGVVKVRARPEQWLGEGNQVKITARPSLVHVFDGAGKRIADAQAAGEPAQAASSTT